MTKRIDQEKLDAYVDRQRSLGRHLEMIAAPTRAPSDPSNPFSVHRDSYACRLTVVDCHSTTIAVLPAAYTPSSFIHKD
jgi:hypothetical protein